MLRYLRAIPGFGFWVSHSTKTLPVLLPSGLCDGHSSYRATIFAGPVNVTPVPYSYRSHMHSNSSCQKKREVAHSRFLLDSQPRLRIASLAPPSLLTNPNAAQQQLGPSPAVCLKLSLSLLLPSISHRAAGQGFFCIEHSLLAAKGRPSTCFLVVCFT